MVYKFGKHANEGAIHHRNEEKLDNRFENLAVMHFSCHRQHHTLGSTLSDETREKIKIALTGHEVSEVTRQKIGDANRGNLYCLGRQASDETRRKLSETMRTREERVECECGLVTRAGSLISHLRATGHERKVPS